MHEAPFRTGLDAIYRASPLFELIPYGRLSESDREGTGTVPETEIYGIVRRRDGGGPPRVVDAPAALLLLSLVDPGQLPPCLRADRCLDEVARLVLDGPLEMWDGADFVSGGAALELVSGASDRQRARESALAALSRHAIRHAAELVRWVAKDRQVVAVAEALYGYHRCPLTAGQARFWGGADGVAARLGVAAGGPVQRSLAGDWREKLSGGAGGWWFWRRRGVPAIGRGEVTFKLYISPQPRALPETFSHLVGVVGDTGALGFKVGRTASGVLRPDKLVLYFRDFEALSFAARRLEPELVGLEVHGVPFTAQASPDGLLSWGIDPPREDEPPAWRQRESWRLRICLQAAAALVSAAAAPVAGGAPLWRLALERLRLEGVDVDEWTPSLAPAGGQVCP